MGRQGEGVGGGELLAVFSPTCVLQKEKKKKKDGEKDSDKEDEDSGERS